MGTTATVSGETATTWAINSIKGSTKNTLDCDSTYTDGTDNTDAREKVVKDAMATAQHATSSKVGGTIASKLATAKLVTGALSTVATVGAAIAALSMSFRARLKHHPLVCSTKSTTIIRNLV